ncbi:MAG TPA: putative Na+/H+ antiporter [Noviherbaspirillum sp.]|uniref:putative Na+/H+ antiporter n=1 Tax=Noviherbaspirillum sp. TaxID=1926288 RepID=UPI002B4A43EA|nr:putative Na+/H+ antiporter [Noviherbaspirillum sp.]HJV83865.1 putative Na+/H+ antiporter [Noviherbaspirillum sp.]
MASLTPNTVEIIAAVVFAVAVMHTFSTGLFAQLGALYPRHAGLWHLLGEVEVVFGFWALVLVVIMFFVTGRAETVHYLDGRNYTEPMFVFVIMVIAASRPILQAVLALVQKLAQLLPVRDALAVYFLCLSLVPLLGSFITEPAAMTLAAILLRNSFFSNHLGTRLQYASLGVLFVNVSIGGTLTSFAAPPVLMVAATWHWDTAYMFTHFGWKAAVAVIVNAAAVTWIFRHEIAERGPSAVTGKDQGWVPLPVVAVHAAFLFLVVVFVHHSTIFMGLFLFFLGFTHAYQRYQDRLILREGLMVSFFLAGLVTLGGLQQWWLESTLANVEATPLYFIATALTAVTDNAALTYLGSLVEGVSPQFKYALVAGAVTGGGLTVIANAPNPAGFSILKPYFRDEAISASGLFAAAFLPTCVAILAFQVL